MKKQFIFLLTIVYLISVIGSIPTISVRAATVVVTNTNDSGTGSLRQTIIDATNGDTITFDNSLSGQTIRLQSTLTIDKNITIDASALLEKIILSGDSDNDTDGDIKLINITANKTVTIKNIKFTKGFSPSYTLNAGAIDNLGILNVYDSEFDFNAGGQGGAIRNSGNLYVEDNTFTSNSALEGGAILNNINAQAEIRDSTFSGNVANENEVNHLGGAGGAIANVGIFYVSNSNFTNNSAAGGGAFANGYGSTTINNSTFTNNSASAEHGGGAINNFEGTVNITQSTFTNNSATYGGAIMAGDHPNGPDTTTTISESIISNNQATAGGGGIEFDSGTSMTIDKTTISGNTAPAAGGIANVSGNLLTITNSTISNNTATQSPQPGGILSLFSPVTIKNSTVTGNNHTAVGIQGNAIISNTTIAGNSGYGLEVFTNSLSITNSILANNTNTDCRIQWGATVTTNQNNIIETNSGCGTPASTADPLLGPLADNGGLTETMALLQNSPALETGNNATCETTDQRGILRPQGTVCDLGAYEYQLFPSLESISRVNASPTSSATVNFTVVFSEDVTGVDVSDFTLTTTGIINSSITNVSGTNTTYTISVNTGSGDGTIRLDFVDDDTVINQFSNSPNADFTTGEVYVIDKPNLSAPRLRSPRNYITTNDSTPTLWWSNVNGAQSYEIQLSTNSDFSSGVISEISNSISHTLITSLTDGTYFWRVRVYNTGKWSTSRTIIIDTTAPAIPILISPNDNSTLSSSYTFRWASSATAVLYEFQYDNNADFSSPMTITIRATSRRLPNLPDGDYSWRVRAKDATGNWSDWSPHRTFEIDR